VAPPARLVCAGEGKRKSQVIERAGTRIAAMRVRHVPEAPLRMSPPAGGQTDASPCSRLPGRARPGHSRPVGPAGREVPAGGQARRGREGPDETPRRQARRRRGPDGAGRDPARPRRRGRDQVAVPPRPALAGAAGDAWAARQGPEAQPQAREAHPRGPPQDRPGLGGRPGEGRGHPGQGQERHRQVPAGRRPGEARPVRQRHALLRRRTAQAGPGGEERGRAGPAGEVPGRGDRPRRRRTTSRGRRST